MRIINGYRVEKDKTLQQWIAFDKKGINGWFEARRDKTLKSITTWCEKQSPKEKRKKDIIYE